MLCHLEVHPDPTAALAAALSRRLRFGTAPVNVLVSAAPALFPAWDALGSAPIAWERVTLWPSEVPVEGGGDWARMWSHLAVPATFREVAVDREADASGTRAAARYAEQLAAPPCRGVLDHAVLVLGANGALGALTPGSPALRERGDVVAVAGASGATVSVTLPLLARCRAISLLAVGAHCRDVVARLVQGDPTIPAGRLRHPDFMVFADAEAGR